MMPMNSPTSQILVGGSYRIWWSSCARGWVEPVCKYLRHWTWTNNIHQCFSKCGQQNFVYILKQRLVCQSKMRVVAGTSFTKRTLSGSSNNAKGLIAGKSL
jgi:hypothetical protein